MFRFIFSSNEDDLCHSTRMTFLGSIKRSRKRSFSLFLTHSSSRINQHQHEESASNFWTIVFSWRSFLYHLFIPSRPTGSRNFKLDALFLLKHPQLLSSLCTTHSKGSSLKLLLKFLELINILVHSFVLLLSKCNRARQPICFVTKKWINKRI